ncbi:SPOR domain-containing protein [Vibrio gallicus]|uniref:SPOR domain-containing protein n=1 Tax=Vibrio gallicus TaxID=190897 RepID=UPI0021C4BA5E|nr:SPOR domain-containing protein [Vibrio gallicus]
MASKFQSRLVGTIVLVAVGVIVLPDILDGQKLHYKEEFVAIPIKPELESEVESFKVLDPVKDEATLPPSPVEEVVHEVKSEPKPVKSPPKQVVNIHSKPVEVVEVQERKVEERNHYQDGAFIIQLVALRNAENAEVMVSDLRKRGFQAHVKTDKTLSRVIVGPDASRSKLESQIPELKKITGLTGQIQTFKPLNP